MNINFDKNTMLTKILVFLMCLILLSSQSIYELTSWGKYLKIIMLGLSFLLGSLSIFDMKTTEKKNGIFVFLILLIYILILHVINTYNLGQNGKSFLVAYFTLTFMYLYFCYNKLEQKNHSYLLKSLTNIIVFFASLSLIMWLMISILKLIQPTQFIELNWGNPHYIPSYFHLYFETQNVSFGSLVFMRNTWIYPEAPIFSFVLSFALMYRSFIENQKITSKKSVILMTTIITTGSSTGFIVLAIIVFTQIAVYFKKFGRMFFFVTGISVMPILLIVINWVVKQKFTNNQSSLNVRLEDIVIGFQGLKAHPFIGNGYGDYSVLLEKMTAERLTFNGNAGFSSGLSLIAAYGGILLLLIYLVPIIKGSIIGIKENINLLFFSITIFFLLLTTIVQTNFIILMVLPFLLNLNEKIKKRENTL